MGVTKYAHRMIFSGFMKLKRGKLVLSKTRAIILPAPFVASFLEESYQQNGDEIFEMMFNAARDLAHDTVDRMGRENKMVKREFLSTVADSANLLGIGRIKIDNADFDNEVLEVSLTGSPLVDEIRDSEIPGELDEPISLFLKGAAHGIGEEVLDAEVKSEYISSEYVGDQRTNVRVESK